MNRGLRTALVLAVALVAALGASYMAFSALQRMAAANAGAATPVVVAAREIPLGTLITSDHVRVVSWPVSSPVQGAFAHIDQVVNRGAIMPLALNEPLTEAKVAALGSGAGLSPTITPGMRAISIKVNEVVGVAGFVVPGSRVDVLVTIEPPDQAGRRNSETRVVTSNVQVLTAGTRIDQDTAQADGKPIPSTVVTLLVSPEDAERVALAQNEGRITLTLRNPLDLEASSTPGAKMASLLGVQTDNTPAPAAAPRPRPTPVVAAPLPEPAPKRYTVEAIRGAKRTEEIIK
jgi:pilus assembly protein CpaB